VTFTSGSPSKYATAFLKRMQTVGIYINQVHSELVFILVSILVLAKAIFIAFMAFLPHYSPDNP
jgi:hypothetical protein